MDAKHGLLITATICRRDGDAVYLSRDQGATWQVILHRLDKGVMDFRLSYMQPRFNGGGNLIHWLTDVKIDPHHPDTAWFNTGTGVFRTRNLTGDPVHWEESQRESVSSSTPLPSFPIIIRVFPERSAS